MESGGGDLRPRPRGQATISSDILASYAADAIREVDGVQGLVGSTLHRHEGVRVLDEAGGVRVELHIALRWGSSIPAVGPAVQKQVIEYLSRMADIQPVCVDVVIEEIGPR
jgi:uncharacterized alkaline shock family protein YloU